MSRISHQHLVATLREVSWKAAESSNLLEAPVHYLWQWVPTFIQAAFGDFFTETYQQRAAQWLTRDRLSILNIRQEVAEYQIFNRAKRFLHWLFNSNDVGSKAEWLACHDAQARMIMVSHLLSQPANANNIQQLETELQGFIQESRQSLPSMWQLFFTTTARLFKELLMWMESLQRTLANQVVWDKQDSLNDYFLTLRQKEIEAFPEFIATKTTPLLSKKNLASRGIFQATEEKHLLQKEEITVIDNPDFFVLFTYMGIERNQHITADTFLERMSTYRHTLLEHYAQLNKRGSALLRNCSTDPHLILTVLKEALALLKQLWEAEDVKQHVTTLLNLYYISETETFIKVNINKNLLNVYLKECDELTAGTLQLQSIISEKTETKFSLPNYYLDTVLPFSTDLKFSDVCLQKYAFACGILELPLGQVITPKQIKTQYRQLARKVHPDNALYKATQNHPDYLLEIIKETIRTRADAMGHLTEAYNFLINILGGGQPCPQASSTEQKIIMEEAHKIGADLHRIEFSNASDGDQIVQLKEASRTVALEVKATKRQIEKTGLDIKQQIDDAKHQFGIQVQEAQGLTKMFEENSQILSKLQQRLNKLEKNLPILNQCVDTDPHTLLFIGDAANSLPELGILLEQDGLFGKKKPSNRISLTDDAIQDEKQAPLSPIPIDK